MITPSVILDAVTELAANFPVVTARLAIALVSTASLASSLAPTASAAICPAVIELSAIFAPGISALLRFNFA